MRPNRRNYYRILHVQPDAPVEIIRASYRTLMQRLRAHPDLGGDHWNAALINEAYQVLTHAARRAAYDLEFKAVRRRAMPARDPGETIHTASARAGCFFCGVQPTGLRPLTVNDMCSNCRSPLYPADRRKLNRDGMRNISRLSRRHPLVIFSRWPQAQAHTGESRDISLHGIRFVTAEALAAGGLAKIDSDICRAVARIINVRPNDGGDGRWMVGAEFLSVVFPRPR